MAISDKVLGARIKARRERLDALRGGYSQEDIAKQLGLTRAGYAHWEQGRRGVSVPDLSRLADLLEVSIVFFFADEDPSRLPGETGDEAEDRLEGRDLFNSTGSGTGAYMASRSGGMEKRLAGIEGALQELLERFKQADKE